MDKNERIDRWRARRQETAREARESRLDDLDEAGAADAHKAGGGEEASAGTGRADDTSKGETGDGARERAARLRASFAENVGTARDERIAPAGAAAAAMLREGARAAGGMLNRGLPTVESIGEAHQVAAERRERIVQRRRIRYLVLLGLPLLLFAFYSVFLASTLYEATTVFTVTTASKEQGGAAASPLALGAPAPSLSQEYEMREFLTSRAAMQAMEEEHGYLQHLAATGDMFTGPGKPFGLTDELDYYRRRVNISVNVQEGLATLHVHAATQEDALRYSGALLEFARERLAGVAKQLNDDQVAALEEEVQAARNAVSEASAEVGRVQEARGEIDPVLATTSVYELISQLELKRSEARAQRDSLRANGLDESPLLPRLGAQIATLESQIAEQRERLTGTGAGSVRRSIGLLERAVTRRQLAETTLAATLETLEQARLEALKQRPYLVIVAPPSAPDRPNVWRTAKAFSWLVLFIVALGAGYYVWRLRRGDPIEE